MENNSFVTEIPVCVLSYNHPQITARCLQSCLQHVSPHLIYLLHNGSESRNVQTLREQFPQVQHWVLEKNRGYTGGINEILKKGFDLYPWLLILTNDCELLSKPQAPSTPGLYGVQTWARKRGRVDSCLGKINFLNGKLSHLKKIEEVTLLPSEKIYVHGAAFVVHRNVFLKVGIFDEDLYTYCEDVDYSLRAAKANFPLGLVEQLEVLHHIGKTCHKDPLYTTYYYQRNRRRVTLRHCPKEFLLRLKIHFFFENWRTRIRLFLSQRKKNLALFNQALRDI